MLLRAIDGEAPEAAPAPGGMFRGLACGGEAPALGASQWHVSFLHDAGQDAAVIACRQIAADLQREFNDTACTQLVDVGAAVAPSDAPGLAARTSVCLLLYVTIGLLESDAAVAALKAAINAGVRVLLVYETDPSCGGRPAFEDFVTKTVKDKLGAMPEVPHLMFSISLRYVMRCCTLSDMPRSP